LKKGKELRIAHVLSAAVAATKVENGRASAASSGRSTIGPPAGDGSILHDEEARLLRGKKS
jgi:hypothetical protein